LAAKVEIAELADDPDELVAGLLLQRFEQPLRESVEIVGVGRRIFSAPRVAPFLASASFNSATPSRGCGGL
jgi:hypothetical protein